MEFHITFYRADNGREPIRELLNELKQTNPKLHALLEAGLEKVRGSDRHRKRLTRLVDHENRIYELRVGGVNIARAFFFYGERREIVVTNGYVKKQQDLDKNELETARRYKRDWEEHYR